MADRDTHKEALGTMLDTAAVDAETQRDSAAAEARVSEDTADQDAHRASRGTMLDTAKADSVTQQDTAAAEARVKHD
ncbi:Unannotated [Lentimonas sp. CC19]|uniref:hypothetical protein n=1 Tax=Lentimonas sp. CC19 TaxID=2676097 RepID=UPI00132B4D87|nr:hypothetical protein [Lentimonas sp. CC19]CAA6694953.1 Unannotated [Lentimonas sp. CC19]CAA6695277.1 Unannotated [Lentimonas sp. CC10]